MLEIQKSKIKNSTLVKCIGIFPSADRRKILLVLLIQVFLGVLDLLGVILIGIIGALAVSGIQSSQPGNRVYSVLQLLQLDNLSFQNQTAVLAMVATIVLVGRTLLSVFFTRKILFFIGSRSAVISSKLITGLLKQDLLRINLRSSQETIYSLTIGVVSVTLGVVGTLVSVISDVSLLLIMATGLVIVDPLVALGSFTFFVLVGWVLYRYMHQRAKNFGDREAKLNIKSNEKIFEVLSSYREITVKGRRGHYANRIGEARHELSGVLAELNFLPMISKYVIEGSMVLGAVTVSAIQFGLQDSRHAVATLAIFLAAGTRIAPAILRVQQGAISIKSYMGSAKPTLELMESIPSIDSHEETLVYSSSHDGFEPRIEIRNLNFAYPGSRVQALSNVNLIIPARTICAIVGPSGSGKTTLVDLILGMFSASSGSVSVSNRKPLDAILNFPGAIGYVPQEVSLIQGTIRDNVTMGFPETDISEQDVLDALQFAQLSEFVRNLPEGLNTEVGTHGSKLSGGQRQRIGIARAMYTKPSLLVLDESTSSLDAQTELRVAEAISKIPYGITVIVIAHRLSTVREAQQIVYLQAGEVLATGTFAEVRAAVPDFDTQARLMGL